MAKQKADAGFRNHRWAFNFELTRTGVCLCYSDREFARKWLARDLPNNKVDEEFPRDHTNGCCVSSHDDNRVFLWVNNKLRPGNPGIFYTMIHECVHAMMGVMGMADMEHSRDNCGETEAYIVEWLCRQCWRRLGGVVTEKPREKTKPRQRKKK